MWYRPRRFEEAYRGVFVSPFDYDLNMSTVNLAGLRESCGRELSEKQREAVSRLERLEELGGIDEGLLPERFSYQIKDSSD